MLRQPVESTQYLSIRYTERLTEAGIEPSVGSKGDSLADRLSANNALAESVIGLFKTEVIRRKGPWRNLEDVEFAVLNADRISARVWWFNNKRLLEPIGYIPPAEYEKTFYSTQTNQVFEELLN